MKRREYNHKELDQLQYLKKENDKLKKQVSSLRKQIARLDLDKYENIKDTITEYYQNDRAEEGQKILQKVKDEWLCFECKIGHLSMFVYNKLNETFYFRKCDKCSNRTKPKKYSTDIK